MLFTTDGTLGGPDPKLVLLEDDRHLQPAENVVPVVRREVVRRHGAEVRRAGRSGQRAAPTADLIALNRRVDIDGVTPRGRVGVATRHGF